MESEEWSCFYLRRIPRERIYKLQEIRTAKSCREARQCSHAQLSRSLTEIGGDFSDEPVHVALQFV